MKTYLTFIYNIEDTDISSKNEINLVTLPESVAYSHNPSFNEQATLGRLSPIQVYTNNTAQTYSFSISIHEDILIDNKDIIETVDKLKMFSYPIKEANGNVRFPISYFSIGDIMGYGIITPKIEWRKPFRDGKYIYAIINFDIVVEHDIKPPEITVIKPELEEIKVLDGIDARYLTSTEQLEYAYNGIDYGTLNTQQQMTVSDFYANSNSFGSMVGAAANNLHMFMPTYFMQSIEKSQAEVVKKFMYAQQRMADLYGWFAAADTNLEAQIQSIIASYSEGGYSAENFVKNPIVAINNAQARDILSSNAYAKSTAAKQKEAFESYLNSYYKNYGGYEKTLMTDADRERIKEQAFAIIDSMYELRKEYNSYGAGS